MTGFCKILKMSECFEDTQSSDSKEFLILDVFIVVLPDEHVNCSRSLFGGDFGLLNLLAIIHK